jgi:hypothetical protein
MMKSLPSHEEIIESGPRADVDIAPPRRGRTKSLLTEHATDCSCKNCVAGRSITDANGHKEKITSPCHASLKCRIAGIEVRNGKEWCKYCGSQRLPKKHTSTSELHDDLQDLSDESASEKS